MDLRNRSLKTAQIAELHRFIQQRKLAYQPFAFTNTLQVGEGQKFRDGEFTANAGNVRWDGHPDDVSDLITKDNAAFEESNRELRQIYDGMVDFIGDNVGARLSDLTFAEFGCNTGYFMHSLAARGAKHTTGYDFTENTQVFNWFNSVLGIAPDRNEFRFAEWDSLNHQVRHTPFDEVDVCLSIAVTCHLADPLHHLAFLCSKARKAVFFWCPVDHNDDLSIRYARPGKYPNKLAFPVDFDNDVRPSVGLLRLTLESCGFGKITQLPCPEVSPGYRSWFNSQIGFMAVRTSQPATIYTDGRDHRDLPADAPAVAHEQAARERPAAVPAMQHVSAEADAGSNVPILLEEGYRGFNIVKFQGTYIALAQSIGSVDLTTVGEDWLNACRAARTLYQGNSLADVKRQLTDFPVEAMLNSIRHMQRELQVLTEQLSGAAPLDGASTGWTETIEQRLKTLESQGWRHTAAQTRNRLRSVFATNTETEVDE